MHNLLKSAVIGVMLLMATFFCTPATFAQSVTSSKPPETIKPLPNTPTTPQAPKSIPITITNPNPNPKPAPPDGFAIKVKNAKATPDKAKKNVVVTIQATVPAGKEFDFWASNTDLDFKDKTASNTTFTMPGHAIAITAHFKDINPVNSSSNEIVATSYAATYKIDDSKLNAVKNADKSVTASIVSLTSVDKNLRVTGNIKDEDIVSCIEFGKIFAAENKVTSPLKIEVKLPISDDLSKLTVKITKNTIDKIANENISQFIISTKEGAIQFDKAAITALKTQLKDDFNLVLNKYDKNLPTDRVGYNIELVYENIDTAITMPPTGIKATIVFEIENEKNNNKITITGINATGISEKVPGASYNAKLKAAIIPIGVYKNFSIGI